MMTWIIIKVHYCPLILNENMVRLISTQLFTRILKRTLSTSSGFTLIWVYNKCDLPIYNHFITLNINFMIQKNTQLVISNKYLPFLHTSTQYLLFNKSNIKNLFESSQIYFQINKWYSLKILYHMFLYFKVD